VFQDDWLQRQIQQIADAIAHIAGASAGATEEVDDLLDDAYGKLLGPHREFLNAVDPATLAHLLGDPARIRALAELTALEMQRTDDPATAARLRHRGLGLLDALDETTEKDEELRRTMS